MALMYTVFICDDNENSLEVLSLTIKKDPRFNLVAQANDGKSAIDLIERYRPDIIVLDIVMPEYDGVYIVKHIRKNMNKYDPIIYILSGFGTDPIVRALNGLGVDFYSMKPVPMNVIVSNLNTLIEQRGNAAACFAHDEDGVKKELAEDIIRSTFLNLGIMPHRISSKCITDALLIYMRDPGSSPLLTKVIYPEIAKKYGLNNSSVEKNIRNAICQMKKNGAGIYNEIFSYSTKGHVTNGEFLSVMADYINKYMRNSRHSEVKRYEQ